LNLRGLAFLAVLTIAAPSYAQVTTAKPATPTFDTGEALFPDHCWMLTEGSGTSLNDACAEARGTTQWDLTITGADWAVDGTHGGRLDFVAANSDRAGITAITAPAVHQMCFYAKKATDPGAAQSIYTFGDTSADTNIGLRVGTTGLLISRVTLAGVAESDTNAFDWVANSGTNFQLICGGGSDTIIYGKGATTGLESTVTTTTVAAALDKFTIGCELDNTSAQICTDMNVIFAFMYTSAKTNGQLDTVAVANPWPVLGIDADAAPVVTVGPTETPIANGHNCAGTVTGSGTITAYCGIANPGAAAPSCTQLKAGTDGSAVALRHSASEVWVTGVSNNFDVAEAGNPPVSDVYFCAANASGDTAVTPFTDQLRSPDASQAITVTTSIAATAMFAVQTVASCDTTDTSALVTGCGAMAWLQPGMLVDLSAGFADLTNVIVECVAGATGCEELNSGEIQFETAANAASANITVTQDAYYAPTVATGDAIEGNTTTSGGGTITVGVDAEVSCAGTCSGFQTWTYNVQDVSQATTGNFTSGPPNWGTDDTVYIGSSRPVITSLPDFFLFYEGVALSDVTVSCSEPDSQTTSVTTRTSPPTGTSVASSGAWTGTPTVEDEAGTNLTFDCLDSGGLYATSLGHTFYVTDDEVTNPNGVGDTVAEYRAKLGVVRGWLGLDEQTTETSECSDTVAIDDIISTTPAAAATITATEAVAVSVSLGTCPSSGGASGNGVSPFSLTPFPL
jgi:hypothetical protein